MKTFLISLQTELMKVRHSAALWMVLAGSAFLPLMQILMYLTKTKNFMAELGKDLSGSLLLSVAYVHYPGG
jgi:hypothetical protein